MPDKYIYISYAHKDRDYALALVHALELHGLRVWVNSRDILPGMYGEQVNRAIENASVMLVIVTPESEESRAVQNELSRAKTQNVPIVSLIGRDDNLLENLGEFYTTLRDLLNENDAKADESKGAPIGKSSTLDQLREEKTTSPPPRTSPAIEQPASVDAPFGGAPPMPPPPSPQAAQPPGSTGAPSITPQPVNDEVRFTAFRPQHPTVGKWHTLLVYAHLDSLLETVIKDAGLFEESMGGTPESSSTKTAVKLPRNTKLRIVPACDGVTFNPEFREFNWLEDWHRADFRFQPEQRLDGTEDLIIIGIYADLVPISTLKLAVRFGDPTPTPIHSVQTVAYTHSAPPKTLKQTASMYREDQIFISYSHADTAVALRFRDTCRALGFNVLIDRDKLRSGEVWNEALQRMIVEADIFQLFWSERAAHSKYVQQEWQYARELQQNKQKPTDFIRPVHWEAPQLRPPPPSELQDLHFAYMPLTDSGLQRVLLRLRVLLQKLIGH